MIPGQSVQPVVFSHPDDGEPAADDRLAPTVDAAAKKRLNTPFHEPSSATGRPGAARKAVRRN